MGIIIAIGLILLALTILIVIHELGHFWAARIFGMRVEAFALFFGKKLWGIKRGDTEWRINAVPLGGYVKITGMLDEHFDEEQMDKPPEPYEFRSKPIWQRLIVMLGGIIMNIILGCFIFILYAWIVGEQKIPMENASHGVYAPDSSASWLLGFRTGDKLLNYRGEELEYFSDYADPNLIVDRGKFFTVQRGDSVKTITMPDDYINTFQASGGGRLFTPDGLPILDVRSPDDYEDWEGAHDTIKAKVPMGAHDGGLRDGDRVLMIDSVDMKLYSQVADFLRGKKNQTFSFVVDRAGKRMDLAVTSNDKGLVGFAMDIDTITTHVSYTFGASIPRGITMAFKSVTNTIKGLGAVATGNADPTKSLSGPIQIAGFYERIFSADGWAGFWRLTGMLSMVLAVMNLLPIPVLDGGQVLILMVEGVIGREIPQKIKLIILNIGLWMVIALMAFIFLNDILKFF